MPDSPVTREELAAHLEPITNSMNDVAIALRTMAEQSVRLKNHSKDIRDLKDITKDLVTHKTETKIYWKLFGAVATILLVAVANLMFFKS